MYRGCRRLVCSLVCVFSILFMLFLDTCTVNASEQVISSVSVTRTFNYNADTTWISYNDSATNLIYPNASYVSGSEVYRIPFYTLVDVSALDTLDRNTYYTVSIGNPSISVSGGDYNSDSIAWLNENEELMFTGTSFSGWIDLKTQLGVKCIRFTSPAKAPLKLWVEVPTNFIKTVAGSSGDARKGFVFTLSCQFSIRPASQAEIDYSKIEVSDSTVANNTQETADNTSSILTSITDFFGSFFENLLHIFVPEDGYFSTWFDKVNTLLSDKLGMLYAPFDLVISTLQAIYSSSTTESGIPFPGIKWEDTWLVEPFTFTFASLGSNFDDLRDKVYFATDTVLVLTFLMLLQSKVKLILEGHE